MDSRTADILSRIQIQFSPGDSAQSQRSAGTQTSGDARTAATHQARTDLPDSGAVAVDPPLPAGESDIITEYIGLPVQDQLHIVKQLPGNAARALITQLPKEVQRTLLKALRSGGTSTGSREAPPTQSTTTLNHQIKVGPRDDKELMPPPPPPRFAAPTSPNVKLGEKRPLETSSQLMKSSQLPSSSIHASGQDQVAMSWLAMRKRQQLAVTSDPLHPILSRALPAVQEARQVAEATLARLKSKYERSDRDGDEEDDDVYDDYDYEEEDDDSDASDIDEVKLGSQKSGGDGPVVDEEVDDMANPIEQLGREEEKLQGVGLCADQVSWSQLQRAVRNKFPGLILAPAQHLVREPPGQFIVLGEVDPVVPAVLDCDWSDSKASEKFVSALESARTPSQSLIEVTYQSNLATEFQAVQRELDRLMPEADKMCSRRIAVGVPIQLTLASTSYATTGCASSNHHGVQSKASKLDPGVIKDIESGIQAALYPIKCSPSVPSSPLAIISSTNTVLAMNLRYALLWQLLASTAYTHSVCDQPSSTTSSDLRLEDKCRELLGDSFVSTLKASSSFHPSEAHLVSFHKAKSSLLGISILVSNVSTKPTWKHFAFQWLASRRTSISDWLQVSLTEKQELAARKYGANDQSTIPCQGAVSVVSAVARMLFACGCHPVSPAVAMVATEILVQRLANMRVRSDLQRFLHDLNELPPYGGSKQIEPYEVLGVIALVSRTAIRETRKMTDTKDVIRNLASRLVSIFGGLQYSTLSLEENQRLYRAATRAVAAWMKCRLEGSLGEFPQIPTKPRVALTKLVMPPPLWFCRNLAMDVRTIMSWHRFSERAQDRTISEEVKREKTVSAGRAAMADASGEKRPGEVAGATPDPIKPVTSGDQPVQDEEMEEECALRAARAVAMDYPWALTRLMDRDAIWGPGRHRRMADLVEALTLDEYWCHTSCRRSSVELAGSTLKTLATLVQRAYCREVEFSLLRASIVHLENSVMCDPEDDTEEGVEGKYEGGDDGYVSDCFLSDMFGPTFAAGGDREGEKRWSQQVSDWLPSKQLTDRAISVERSTLAKYARQIRRELPRYVIAGIIDKLVTVAIAIRNSATHYRLAHEVFARAYLGVDGSGTVAAKSSPHQILRLLIDARHRGVKEILPQLSSNKTYQFTEIDLPCLVYANILLDTHDYV